MNEDSKLTSQDIISSLLRGCLDLDLESWCVMDALGKPRLRQISEFFGATEKDTERLLCSAQCIKSKEQV
jgi:hypothetical protein